MSQDGLSLSDLLRLLLKHGQHLMVYPHAFLPESEKQDLEVPEEYGLPGEEVEITTSDGCTLCCFLIRRQREGLGSSSVPSSSSHSSDARATVIVCHGNGMNHGELLEPIVKPLYDLKCNILTLSYRGYGKSNGKPTESGLKKDAQAVLDFVTNTSDLSSIPTVMYGLSLGGAVAIDLTARNPDKISALIVENTFLSLPAIVREWPYIGVFSFLCHQKWDSSKSIKFIPPTLPILMLSGSQDEVVPQRHMKELWEIASRRQQERSNFVYQLRSKFRPMLQSCMKERGKTPQEERRHSSDNVISNTRDVFATFPMGTHASTMNQPDYWATVDNFLSSVLVENQEHGSTP